MFRIESYVLSFCSIEDRRALTVVYRNKDVSSRFDRLAMETGFNPMYPDIVCTICDMKGMKCICHPVSISTIQHIANPIVKVILEKFIKMFCFSCGKPFRKYEEMKLQNIETSRLRIAAKLVEKNAKCSSSACPQIHIETSASEIILEFTSSTSKMENRIIPHSEIREFMDKVNIKYYELFELDKNSVLNAISNQITFLPIGMLPKGYVEGREIIPDIVGQYDRIIDDIKIVSTSKSTEPSAALIKDFYALVVKPRSRKLKGAQFKPHNVEMSGKNGFIRQRAMTKRCPGTGRAVLAPARIDFGDIQIPRLFVENMLTEISVNVLNIGKLRKMVEQGIVVKYKTSEGNWYNIRGNTKLEYGMVLMRKLMDGDMVVFNRQPTLHSYSIMAYQARVTDENVIRIHSSCTTPHGGDFDGDESNIKFMRYIKALTENWTLMNVKNCILGIQGNYPTMAIVFNGIAGGYLLSIAEEVDVEYFVKTYNLTHKDCDAVLRKYDVEKEFYSSGRYVCSLLFPRWLDYKNGYLLIENGVLVSGYLSKKSLSITERGIVHLIAHYDLHEASKFITKAQYVFDDYLQRRGLTLDFKNYNQSLKPSDFEERFEEVNNFVAVLEKRKKETSITHKEELEEAIQLCIQSLMDPIVENMRKLDKGLELVILALLSEARGDAGSITSIVGCIGQQFFNNMRFNSDNQHPRITPYERNYATSITDRGFTKNSYVEGLNPIDNIRNHQSARLSIVIQYLKTPEAGKIAKDLSTHLSCFFVDHDDRVRGYKNILFSNSFGYNVKYEMLINTRIGKVATVFDIDNVIGRLKHNTFLGIIDVDTARKLSNVVSDFYERYVLVILLLGKNNYVGLDIEIIKIYYNTRISSGRAVGIDCCLSLSQPLTQIMLKVQHKSSQKGDNPADLFFNLKGLSFKDCSATVHPKNFLLTEQQQREWSSGFEKLLLTDILKHCIGNSLYTIEMSPTQDVWFYQYWEEHKTTKDKLRIQIQIDQRKLVRTKITYVDVIHSIEKLKEVRKVVPSPLTNGGVIDVYFKTRKIQNNDDRKELLKGIENLLAIKIVDKDMVSYKLLNFSLRDVILDVMEMKREDYLKLVGNCSLNGKILTILFLENYIMKFYPIERLGHILGCVYFYDAKTSTLAIEKKINIDEIINHKLSSYYYTKFYGKITLRFMRDENINHSKTILSNPLEMKRWFGIEAARCVTESLFQSVYEHSSYYVSCKHFRLISNYIISGKLRPINNIAFKKQKRGFLENCLYDDYASTLTNATCFPKRVSTRHNIETSVVFGNKINTGTGFFKIFIDEGVRKRIYNDYIEYMKNRGVSSCTEYLRMITTTQIVNETGLGTSGKISDVKRISSDGKLLKLLLSGKYDRK